MATGKYITNVKHMEKIPPAERELLAKVAERYVFRVNEYYLSLINWDDPEDPIRRIVIPQGDELKPGGALDASDEADNYVAPGCQHKYGDTALLLVNEVCGAYCRFCFRKRLFMNDNDEVEFDPQPGIDYISRTPGISDVLLTGGDPLLLSVRRLGRTLEALRQIEHVNIIRLGTKMPAFNPKRIYEDTELLETLSRYSTPQKRIYAMVHFNHPRELTPEAYRCLDALHRAGLAISNQTPILKGINDDSEVLAELMRRLSAAGAQPYYFFQGRPTEGNKPFDLPIVRSYELITRAMSRVSGLAGRARLVMSHDRGKIEIQTVTDTQIICRFHRAKNPRDQERVMVFARDDQACWFDDLMAQDRSTRLAGLMHSERRKPRGHAPAHEAAGTEASGGEGRN